MRADASRTPHDRDLSGADRGARPRVRLVVAVLAVVWCGLVLLAHMNGAWLACGFDTSGCASTTAKTTVYRGQLPYANTPFALAGLGFDHVGGFRTDSHGRYCIVWTSDGASFIINGQEDAGYFMGSMGTPLHGPAPAGCQYGDGGAQWDRSRDLRSSWQYISVLVLGLATIGVLIRAIALRRSRRGRLLLASGLVLTVASTVLPLVLWWSQL